MSRTPPIPHIHLLCMHPSASTAFNKAIESHDVASSSSISYTIHNTYLADLDPSHCHFDLVVSPANSYGRLDGGFDDAISRAWAPRDDYHGLTRAVQAQLYKTHRGFLPPGGCEIVGIPEEFRGRGRYASTTSSHGGGGDGTWGCRYVGVCPTMRVPGSCEWDREVVYECVWSLLCAIHRHNSASSTPNSSKIESILMTPLGTGVGGLSVEKWAQQTVLALKHYVEAVNLEEKWSGIGWKEAQELSEEVEGTHGL